MGCASSSTKKEIDAQDAPIKGGEITAEIKSTVVTNPHVALFTGKPSAANPHLAMLPRKPQEAADTPAAPSKDHADPPELIALEKMQKDRSRTMLAEADAAALQVTKAAIAQAAASAAA